MSAPVPEPPEANDSAPPAVHSAPAPQPSSTSAERPASGVDSHEPAGALRVPVRVAASRRGRVATAVGHAPVATATALASVTVSPVARRLTDADIAEAALAVRGPAAAARPDSRVGWMAPSPSPPAPVRAARGAAPARGAAGPVRTAVLAPSAHAAALEQAAALSSGAEHTGRFDAAAGPAMPAVQSPAALPERPAPTREATLDAFQRAAKPVAIAPMPAPARAAPRAPARAGPATTATPSPPPARAAAPASPFVMTPGASAMVPAPLARLNLGSSAPPPPAAAEPTPASAAPDIDQLADYVLDRLRRELRDGRERLGFLLDDAR